MDVRPIKSGTGGGRDSKNWKLGKGQIISGDTSLPLEIYDSQECWGGLLLGGSIVVGVILLYGTPLNMQGMGAREGESI